MLKINHSNGSLSSAFNISFLTEEKIESHIVLTDGHFMYVQRDNDFIHIPSREVRVTDKLLSVRNEIGFSPAQIIKIAPLTIPSEDMIQVYTSSSLLTANSLFASCKSDKDGSELFLKPFSILQNYIHHRLPQMISDVYHSAGMRPIFKFVFNMIL